MPDIILSSSMAEHSTVNRRVAGSSPAWGVFYCKGFSDLTETFFNAVHRV